MNTKNTNTNKTKEHDGIIVQYAASLSMIEVGLGSLIHAFRVPMGGHWLSINQGIVLSHASARIGTSSYNATAIISIIVAILKSISPSTKKLGPMIAICMQGALFSLGIFIFGSNILGVIFGICLLSGWAFLQSLLTLYFLYGYSFINAAIFYVEKMNIISGLQSKHLFWALAILFILKCLIGSSIAVFFFIRPEKKVIYTDSLLQWAMSNKPKKSYSKYSGLRGIIHSALSDMIRPLFLFSLSLMIIFFSITNDSYKEVIWLSLRPVSIAFLFFFFSRHPIFYKYINRLRSFPRMHKLFNLVDQTSNHLDKKKYD